MIKTKHRLGRRTAIGLSIFVAVLMASVGLAGFLTQVGFHGTVATAKITADIIDYSGTWVYKNLETHELVRLTYEADDPNLMLISSAKAYPYKGDGNYDVEFVFDNIFPCVDFTADFVFRYTGTIPVVVDQIFFNADQWLQPYIRWDMFSCEWRENGWVLLEPVYLHQQIHNGATIHVDVTVHLPQDNSLQDLDGTFTGGIILLQWNDRCAKDITLPGTPVTSYVTIGKDSYFNNTLSGVPSGFTVNNSKYVSWCVDQEHGMILNTPLVTTLWDTYDPMLPYPDPDWDKVNYLINHKTGTRMQVQQAIWCFIDGGYGGGDPVVVGMILDANLHGEGFKPMPGQWCAVLCEFETTTQWIFIEVDP